MQQIKYAINDPTTIPYVGVSLLCCGMCYHIIDLECRKAHKITDEMIPGTHGIFYPENWAVPEFCLATEEGWKNIQHVENLGNTYCDSIKCTDLYYSDLD